MAIAPAQRVVSLANAPVAGLMGQLKTLSEGAPATEESEADADADAGAEPAGEAPAAE
jgi:large subunit ribosomal protein L10